MNIVARNWWRLVFWWKRQTGWLDLDQVVSAYGTIVALVPPDLDGDRTFNLKLDPGQDRLITGFGGRLTSEDFGTSGPSLHCEISPWSSNIDELAATYESLEVGDRVIVTGRWGFDGVHLGTWLGWEILAALLRHQPNVREGWFELHPVQAIEVLARNKLS